MITGCGTLLPSFSMPSSIRSLKLRSGSMPVPVPVDVSLPVSLLMSSPNRSRRPTPQELHDHAHPSPRTTLGQIGALRVVDPAGAGDVEMGEGHVVDERSKERTGGDRTGRSTGEVLEIADLALDHVAVVVPQRQLPAT